MKWLERKETGQGGVNRDLSPIVAAWDEASQSVQRDLSAVANDDEWGMVA